MQYQFKYFGNLLTSLWGEVLGRIVSFLEFIQHQAKDFDNSFTLFEVIVLGRIVLSFLEFMQHQFKDSDNPLTPLEGEILIRSVLVCLENGHLKNGEEIVDEFYSERREKVLLSLNKIKLEGYIEEADNAWDEVPRYRPTEKGHQWCDKNKHHQLTHSTLLGMVCWLIFAVAHSIFTD